MAKYATDDERRAARRRSRREYYARNRQTECARARDRWHSRSHQSLQVGQAQQALSAQETLMPATCSIVGPALYVEEDVFLGPLAIALEEDMALWSDGLHSDTLWERLAQRLIGEERRQQPSARLHRLIAIKRQHAGFLNSVAEQGSRIAWLHGGDDSPASIALQAITVKAYQLVSGLDQLVTFSELGDGTLKREYDACRLIYQHC